MHGTPSRGGRTDKKTLGFASGIISQVGGALGAEMNLTGLLMVIRSKFESEY
jgi:hypothetical protein